MTLKRNGWTFAVTLGALPFRALADAETWHGPRGTYARLVRVLWVRLWVDNLPDETVGERGVW